MNNKVVIFSTESSLYFAKLIAIGLGIEVGIIERRNFGGCEYYYRLGIDNRDDLMGKTAIFVGSTHSDLELNELYRVGCALAALGTRQRIFVIPFLGYSTMERAKLPGEVVTAKVIARQLSSIPNTGLGNVFLMMDLHVSGLVHYFEGDCTRYELYAERLLIKAIEDLGLKNFMFASADMGRPAWVLTFANHFKTGFALVNKTRKHEKTKVDAVVGKVRGRKVVIYDDMTRSGGTLIDAARAYLKHGAKKVYAVLSHCALNDKSIVKKLNNSTIERVITTNSHPISQSAAVAKSGKFEIVDVSPIFIQAIQKILDFK